MTNIQYTPRAVRFLPLRLPRICLVVTGRDANELIEKAESLARDNPFLEFRLDFLSQPAAALGKLKQFLEMHQHVVAIATCRRAENGGKFKGSVAAQLEILTKAAIAGCQMVDMELQSGVKVKAPALAKLRSNAALILSFHDFKATRNLEAVLQKMCEVSADYYKIVSTATTLFDNVTMMKFLQTESDKHSLVGICMGEQGIISRVLGVRAGSAFTFASVSPEEATGPGQVTIQQLRGVYRIEQVEASTKVYGIAGDPVEHSLSPAIMNAALRRENVNGVYLSLHAKTIKDLIACVHEIPVHGLSITMPYKQAILKYLDNSDAHTTRIGACNTLVRANDGKLYGFNTDVAGVVGPLEQRLTLAGAKILVLGAGGAARAAVFGLKEKGAEVWILNRSAAAAQTLAKQARARIMKKTGLKKMAFDLIINATPLGMGTSRETPLKEDEINTRFAFDMVYTPAETRFLKMAQARGAQTISGVEMFVHQAARQFEIWTGKPAPQDEMIRVVQACLPEKPAADAKKK